MPSKYLTLRIPRNLLGSVEQRPDGSLVIPDWTQYVTPSHDRSRDRTRRWRARRDASPSSPPSLSPPSPTPLSSPLLLSPPEKTLPEITPSRPAPPANSGWDDVYEHLQASEILRDKTDLYDWKWWDRIAAVYENADFSILDVLKQWEEWLHRKPEVVRKTRDWRKRLGNWLRKGYGEGSWSKPKTQAERDAYWVAAGSRDGASNGLGQVEN